jgi:hypothetical protein
MDYKYIVYAPPYHENGGGAIVLHRLCHLINQCGRDAYLYPYVPSFDLHLHNVSQLGLYVKEIYETTNLANYRINDTFKTPVLPPTENFIPANDCIVIYPETTFGNPLRAKNVVRWLLHNPGHHSGKIHYGPGEIYYRYADYFADGFTFPGSEMADTYLRVQYTPFDLYEEPREQRKHERTGTAYCIKKGKGRAMIHDTGNSLLIDGRSHQQVSAIFKSVKQFICYDAHSHYSSLAAIAGCESVVVPLEGVTKEQWRPNVEDRYGIAYGFDDIESALTTRHLALERQRSLDRDSERSTKDFLADIESRLHRRSGAGARHGLPTSLVSSGIDT